MERVGAYRTKELKPDVSLGIVSQNHPTRCSILPELSKGLKLQVGTST
jgi:hypothetical protein